MQKLTKPGNVQITPVGHTNSGTFGTDPNKRVKGRGEVPTPLTFGK